MSALARRAGLALARRAAPRDGIGRGVEMDLVTRWMLWSFGALLVGGLVGFLVAKLATFELGLGVGLLIPGCVSLSFAAAFVAAYRDLAYDPGRLAGTVVAVEDRAVNASGSITAPVGWTVGVGVVAVNFSAWVVALWLLTEPGAGW